MGRLMLGYVFKYINFTLNQRIPLIIIQHFSVSHLDCYKEIQDDEYSLNLPKRSSPIMKNVYIERKSNPNLNNSVIMKNFELLSAEEKNNYEAKEDYLAHSKKEKQLRSFYELQIKFIKQQLQEKIDNRESTLAKTQEHILLEEWKVQQNLKSPLSVYDVYKASLSPESSTKLSAVEVKTKWNQLCLKEQEKFLKEFILQKRQISLSKNTNEYVEERVQKRMISEHKKFDKSIESLNKKLNYLKKKILGKPKRPPNSFQLFAEELRAKHAHRKYKYMQLKVMYEELTEGEKMKYKEKFQMLKVEYENELVKWEKKMIAKGQTYVVRMTTLTKVENEDLK